MDVMDTVLYLNQATCNTMSLYNQSNGVSLQPWWDLPSLYFEVYVMLGTKYFEVCIHVSRLVFDGYMCFDQETVLKSREESAQQPVPPQRNMVEL